MTTMKCKMADQLANLTSVQETGLARINQRAETDFALECDEGHQIGVQRSVMEGLWPFFKGMMGSNTKEVTDKKLKLSMPKSTQEVLVQYLYGEKPNL